MVMKKLETTRRLVPGTLLRVYRKGYGYGRFTVRDVTDDYFACLCAGNFFYNIVPGDQVEAYMWVENVASYDFMTRILGRLEHLDDNVPPVLFLEHSVNIVRSETRRCLKAHVEMPFRFFLFDSGRIEKNFSSEEILFHQGTILELGDREMLFRPDDPLSARHFLYGHLKLGERQMEIIGKVAAEGDTGLYTVSFPGIPEKERIQILDYIFDVYRE